MSRIDNRTLQQKIADAHWQPPKKPDNRSPLEQAIDEREGKPSRTLHGDKLTLHLLKQEQRKRDDAFDEQERRREHIERNRSRLVHLQTLREKYEENQSVPMEMIVAVDHAILANSDPDACEKTAGEMYKGCFVVEQERQDAIARGIEDRRNALEAELAELRKYQFPEDVADKPVVKVRLESTTLDEQARELFRAISHSSDHTFAETEAVYEAVKAHRAGNSGPVLAAIERYAETEAANDSNASE